MFHLRRKEKSKDLTQDPFNSQKIDISVLEAELRKSRREQLEALIDMSDRMRIDFLQDMVEIMNRKRTKFDDPLCKEVPKSDKSKSDEAEQSSKENSKNQTSFEVPKPIKDFCSPKPSKTLNSKETSNCNSYENPFFSKTRNSSKEKKQRDDYFYSKGYNIFNMELGMVSEMISGTFQKSLLFRFENISGFLSTSKSIDLKTYAKIEQFITKEKKYYENMLKAKHPNLLENFFEANTDEFEKSLESIVDNKSFTRYSKESIVQMKYLYENLLTLKTEENQFPKDEILAILKGKKVDTLNGQISPYKDDDGKAIQYLKGNHYWEIRCENILTYFNSHKDKNLPLMDYVIDLLIEESNKMKTKDGIPKITDYVQKIIKIDSTAEILRNQYNTKIESLDQHNKYKNAPKNSSFYNSKYRKWHTEVPRVHNVSKTFNFENSCPYHSQTAQKNIGENKAKVDCDNQFNLDKEQKKQQYANERMVSNLDDDRFEDIPEVVAEYYPPQSNQRFISGNKNPFLEDHIEYIIDSQGD